MKKSYEESCEIFERYSIDLLQGFKKAKRLEIEYSSLKSRLYAKNLCKRIKYSNEYL